MGITNKTRKLLWGKSGNRCAMCKNYLHVDSNLKNDESIVGDECHIRSKKFNGPRYDFSYPKSKIDSYENLILLCRVHHKQIDDQATRYTSDILKKKKEKHEKWVSERLDKTPKFPPYTFQIKRNPQNIPKYLRRITSGKEIFNIVEGAHSYSFDNDELVSEEEVKIVGDFLDIIYDCDLAPDLDPSFRVETSYKLTSLINELDDAGFWVFGAIEKQILIANGLETTFLNSIIDIKRKTNPEILKINITDNDTTVEL